MTTSISSIFPPTRPSPPLTRPRGRFVSRCVCVEYTWGMSISARLTILFNPHRWRLSSPRPHTTRLRSPIYTTQVFSALVTRPLSLNKAGGFTTHTQSPFKTLTFSSLGKGSKPALLCPDLSFHLVHCETHSNSGEESVDFEVAERGGEHGIKKMFKVRKFGSRRACMYVWPDGVMSAGLPAHRAMHTQSRTTRCDTDTTGPRPQKGGAACVQQGGGGGVVRAYRPHHVRCCPPRGHISMPALVLPPAPNKLESSG